MDLYAELGKIQFQLEKLEIAKRNVTRQIENQMIIESKEQKTKE